MNIDDARQAVRSLADKNFIVVPKDVQPLEFLLEAAESILLVSDAAIAENERLRSIIAAGESEAYKNISDAWMGRS